MYFSRCTLIIALASLAITTTSVTAFSAPFQHRSGLVSIQSTIAFRTPTYLRNTEGADDVNEEGSDVQDSSGDDNKTESKPDSAANDILNSPAFLKRKLEVLRNDITKIDEDIEAAKSRLEAGKAEWGSQIEDLEKEYKNIQQRLTDQSSKTDDQATMQVARQMLEVLDNFDRAFGQVTAETDDEKTIEAEYRVAYDMILKTFKKLGIEEIKSVGSEFDYEVHQAVMQRPSAEYEEGIVCEEFQKGFKIGNTLIRASMVAVAA